MDALGYARKLIAFDSVSRNTNRPIIDFLEETLNKLGFSTERIEYDDPEGIGKANLIAKKGPGTGGLAYFGHTDVVPAETWFREDHGPFEPTVMEGKLFGRGSCDMKGSLACMLAAAEQVPAAELKAPIYITCTADEEVGYRGAAQVAQRSELYGEMVEGESAGIIGEPTELNVVYAHKGTYGFRAVSRGKAAHSSTREGLNANLAMIPFLVEMKAIHDETEQDPAWQNNAFDPPTVTWNIGINDYTSAVNITPPRSICTVYFRPMPGQNAEILLERARKAAEQCGLEFEVLSKANPVCTNPETEFVRDVLRLAGRERPQTVSFGTDGARFSAMKKLVLLGPGSIAQAHTHNEWIELDQLKQGTDLYGRLIHRWCC